MRINFQFDHGIWLIAYLLLVGSAAPQLLANGEERLLAEPRKGKEALAGGAAWLLGTIAVPLGVLVEMRLPVVVGAGALLVALGSITRRAFGIGAPSASVRQPVSRLLHAVVIAFMVTSTVIGVLLAWHTPWT